MKTIFSFRVAYKTEEELADLRKLKDVDPNSLVLTTLPDGQPSYKILYISADTEEEAITKMNDYVARTSYHNLPDGKFI